MTSVIKVRELCRNILNDIIMQLRRGQYIDQSFSFQSIGKVIRIVWG